MKVLDSTVNIFSFSSHTQREVVADHTQLQTNSHLENPQTGSVLGPNIVTIRTLAHHTAQML